MLPLGKGLLRSKTVSVQNSSRTTLRLSNRRDFSSGSATILSSESTTGMQGATTTKNKRQKRLTPEEALYLAKQAGFYTKKELQEQIIRSPAFSSSKTPMLMDAFLKPSAGEIEEMQAEEHSDDEDDLDEDLNDDIKHDPSETIIPQKIHDALKRMSKNADIASFRDSRTGLEWLTRAEGQGTRSRAAAKVILKRGSGIIKVNGDEDFTYRWPLFYNRLEICLPFQETHAAGLFDVFITVKGGGTSGQAGAVRLAIARALYQARPSCLAELEARELLFEDTRQRISKEVCQKGARAKYRWVKR